MFSTCATSMYLSLTKNKITMKKHMLIFLIMTVVTGLLGFAGMTYYGITAVRIIFLIFADLLIVSLISKFFFPGVDDMKLIKVKK